ncbi:MAG TPA: energy transducer TonB [Spirochaetota bacterium]|nr:energy transducer TonB [Spirochaetota bacterium]
MDESLIIEINKRKFKIRHLFRISLAVSFCIHLVIAGPYFISKFGSASAEEDIVSGFELEHPEIELDIPPELIGGDSSPACVEKQEWAEGTKKDGPDPEEKEINTNRISGDGTDKDGYLFSFNGDSPPRAIVDFDLRRYYPEEARAANIKEYQVTVLVQIDEKGSLISANIASGKAPYGFNEQALKAVKRMRFSPGYKSGKRVKMAHYLPVTFTLE